MSQFSRILLILAVSVVVAIGGCVGARPENAGLTPADLDALGLSDVRDLTLAQETEVPPSAVRRADAVGSAANRVGVDKPPLGILRGHAARLPGEPLRDVWIVIFEGGIAPNEGPIENVTAPPLTMTGVIVDATSGEVLWWFMH